MKDIENAQDIRDEHEEENFVEIPESLEDAEEKGEMSLVQEIDSEVQESDSNAQEKPKRPLFENPPGLKKPRIPAVEVRDQKIAELKSSLKEEEHKSKSLEQQIEVLEKERDQFKDKMQRIAADFQNYKKRVEKEKEDIRAYGVEHFAKDILTVLDNMERALNHIDQGSEDDNLIEGVKMTYRQFKKVLAQHGITSFDSVGEDFDPNKHEALQQKEVEGVEPNKVVEEWQKGYYIKDRLLRPAMVIVSK